MTTAKHVGLWVGALTAAVMAAGAPLAASAGEAHGGGGGGGGAHVSAAGGAHFAGGGGRAVVGGRTAVTGVRSNFAAAPRGYTGAAISHAHFAATSRGGYPASANHFVARSNFTSGGRTVAGGRLVAGSGRFWGGGYWGGRFWPGVHYGPGFAWFLPVLPFGYATYWWGGNPYYYYDGGYYSWDPDYNGYVATDPPPVADTTPSSGTDEAPPAEDAQSQSYDVQPQTYAPPPSNPNNVEITPPQSAPQLRSQPLPPDAASTPPPPRNFSGGVSDVIVYPRNGQSELQTSNDKSACHNWSVAQTGFDPQRSMNLQGTAMDYRRAMEACLDARGYTVR